MSRRALRSAGPTRRGSASALGRCLLASGLALSPQAPPAVTAGEQTRAESAESAEAPGPAPAADEAWALIDEAREEGAPGAEHRRLEPLVGRWLVEATWAVSLERRIETRGTAENRWVLGGRYLRSEMSLGEGSSRLHFLTFYGYSPDLDRYFALDMNDVQSTPARAWGTYEHGSRSLLLTQRDRDRQTNRVRVRRRILTITGLDSYSFEMFLDPTGAAPVRTMKARFTRDLDEPPS